METIKLLLNVGDIIRVKGHPLLRKVENGQYWKVTAIGKHYGIPTYTFTLCTHKGTLYKRRVRYYCSDIETWFATSDSEETDRNKLIIHKRG